MPNRNRNSLIWKDPFYRALPPLYKCLWDYINDDCDNAGVWIPDFKVASICIGKRVKPETALQHFGPKINVLPNGNWLLPGFIADRLCFTELKPSDRFQKSIIDLLDKHFLFLNKGLVSPLQGAIRRTEEEVKVKADTKAEEKGGVGENTPQLEEYQQWLNAIRNGTDLYWPQLCRNANITPNGQLPDLCVRYLALLSEYPKKRPPTQHALRNAFLGFCVEKMQDVKTAPRKPLTVEQILARS